MVKEFGKCLKAKQSKEQEQQAWIENFTNSFKQGKLRQILSNSVRFHRQTCKVVIEGHQITGLILQIAPLDWQSCKYLASKIKPLRYRIRALDPEIKVLFVSNPSLERALGIVIGTGEIVLTSPEGGER